MGSKIGVMKLAASRIGISFEAYVSKRDEGLKWCYRCKCWKSTDHFDFDRSRGDGFAAACIPCRRVQIRRSRKGRAPSAKVQGQASSAISYEIKCGRMARPTELPCRDCGSSADEYHHHLGYARSHWFDVMPLCKSCHVRRHWE